MVRRRLGSPQTIFMNSTPVETIPKNRLEEIRVSVLRNNKVDVRTYFYFPQETGAKPTKKGLWLSFRHIPVIVGILEKLKKNPEEEVDREIERLDKEQLKVYTNIYLGTKVAHIRTFYLKDNKFTPGKGISFALPLIDQIVAALRKAEKLKE